MPSHSSKEIYNALGYLTRKKMVNHVGHGLYFKARAVSKVKE